jgi:hypothetical protein
MAANTSPIFIASANLAEVTFVNADGTSAKDLIAAGADGSKVLAINVTSDDTSDVDMAVSVHDGTTAYLLGTVPVPTLSGTDGSAPSVDLLDSTLIAGLDSDGELFLPSGYKVQVAPLASVTAAKTVTVVCIGGDY